MAHAIFGSRFASVRSPAWHHLGHVFEDPITAVEGLELAGMDYEIVKLPLQISWNGGYVPTGEVALVRTPTSDDPEPRVLGSASERYGLIQNREIAELLDANLTTTMPLETVGALGNGETVFFTLDNGMDDIINGGETVKNYFLITDTRDGKTSMRVAYTPVRVVCQNTLISGLAASTVQWTISHGGSIKHDLEFQTRILGQLKLAKSKTLAIMRQMAVTKVVEAQVDEVLAKAYPVDAPPKWVQSVRSLNEFGVVLNAPDQKHLDRTIQISLAARDRSMAYRAGAKELYTKFGDEQPRVAETAWALMNAIAECADWREGGRDSARIEEMALFGDRAKEKMVGFKACTGLLN